MIGDLQSSIVLDKLLYGFDSQLDVFQKRLKSLDTSQETLPEENLQFALAYCKTVLDLLLLNRGHQMGLQIARKIEMIVKLCTHRSGEEGGEEALTEMLGLIFADYEPNS